MTCAPTSTNTTPSLTVEIHSIESFEQCSTCPAQVSAIYRGLDVPLPAWCATECNGSLPPGFVQVPTILCEDGSLDTMEQSLAGIYGSTLATVLDIRALNEHYGPSRSAAPFVSSLMRILVHSCAPEAIIFIDAAFVLPRTATPEYGLDGVATVLACHAQDFRDDVVDSVKKPSETSLPAVLSMSVDGESNSSSSSSLSSTSSSSSSSSGARLDHSIEPTSAENDSERSNSEISLDHEPLPLDAHILPARGRHTCALLPFFCVGDSNNIVHLMTSAACQRYVWGITEPVIGFVLSEAGVVAKLILSWVDPVTHVVHIIFPACDFKSQLRPPGVFNFADISSALSFSQFIMGLAPHFAIISERARASFENNGLDWRLDNPKIISANFGSWRDRVAQWVHDVEISTGALSLPPTPPPSPSLKASTPQSQSAEGNMAKGKKEIDPDAPPKAYSSSSFAGLSATGLNDPKGAQILTWMNDRRTQRIGRIQFPAPQATPEQAEINRMIGEYAKMFPLCQVPAWTKKRPAVDSNLSIVLDTLLAQLSEQPSNSSNVLSPQHEVVISGRLSALLSATRKVVKIGTPFYIVFYNSTDRIISPYVVLEHTIYFSRNELVDQMHSTSFVETQTEQMNATMDLADSAFKAARSLPNKEVKWQAWAAYTQAVAFSATLETLDEDALKKIVRDRSILEPKSGKCDAILFAAIPDKLKLVKEADLIFFTPPNPSPPPLTASSDLEPENTGPTPDKDLDRYLQNPFGVCIAGPPSARRHPPPQQIPSFKNHLILPHATVEYKKHSETEGKSLNQGRMYLVSLVSFYSVLGIEDRPFYCLVTWGKLGAVLMAWKSSTQKQIYLMERNIRKSDLSSPIEAFQFATFLLRLGDNSKEFAKLVAKTLQQTKDHEDLRKRLRDWRKMQTGDPKRTRSS
ncbi:hypothetical protein C8R43DRAFT_1237086 [Mycena crocata]|nr:hypothetical protein C8R43DRAFT_1237086 [Mycena crocata]